MIVHSHISHDFLTYHTTVIENEYQLIACMINFFIVCLSETALFESD